jgi:hemoglobin
MDERHDIVDERDIDRLVRAFYRRVATDDLLGSVFELAGVDWSLHIPKLVDFWSWQLLGIPGYEGNPLIAHRPIHALAPFREVHYERWLALFDETLDEMFTGPTADAARGRAQKMAGALRRLMDGEPSVPSSATHGMALAPSALRRRG